MCKHFQADDFYFFSWSDKSNINLQFIYLFSLGWDKSLSWETLPASDLDNTFCLRMLSFMNKGINKGNQSPGKQ